MSEQKITEHLFTDVHNSELKLRLGISGYPKHFGLMACDESGYIGVIINKLEWEKFKKDVDAKIEGML